MNLYEPHFFFKTKTYGALSVNLGFYVLHFIRLLSYNNDAAEY